MGLESSDSYHLYFSFQSNESGPGCNHNLQVAAFKVMQQLASEHQCFEMEASYFYLFNKPSGEILFSCECDVLDITDDSICIECYLYLKNTGKFLAKAFAIYRKQMPA